jgi:hypothetical protein
MQGQCNSQSLCETLYLQPCLVRWIYLLAPPQMLPGLLLSPDCRAAEWCQGVGATAAALPAGVALQQWQAPLLANHTDDFKGERCTMQAAGCRPHAMSNWQAARPPAARLHFWRAASSCCFLGAAAASACTMQAPSVLLRVYHA